MVDPHHVFEPKAKVHVQKIRSRSFSQLHLVATSSSMLHRWSQMLPSKIRDNIKYPESLGQVNNWSGLLQCPMGTRTRSATRYLCRYPTRLIFEDNRVADNLNYWVMPNISGKPEVFGSTQYFGYSKTWLGISGIIPLQCWVVVGGSFKKYPQQI